MHPISTPECNFTYKAPPGAPACGDLPCLRQESATTSFWKPTPRELAHLCAGGVVAMTCHGKSHPMVNLGVMPADAQSDINNPEWQREFILPIAKVMQSRKVASMTIHFTAAGKAAYTMDPQTDP